MTEERVVITDDDVDDALHQVGKSWWVVLVVGLLSIGLGLLFIVWPGRTITVLAVLFGVYLIVSGVVSLVQGFNKDLSQGQRVLAILVGVISIVLGVLCFRGGITNGIYILSLFVGFSFLFRGIYQMLAGIQAKGQKGRGLVITAGVLGIIVGVIFLIAPFSSLFVLAMIAGIWLIALGILEVIFAFQIKSDTGN